MNFSDLLLRKSKVWPDPARNILLLINLYIHCTALLCKITVVYYTVCCRLSAPKIGTNAQI